MRTYTEFAVEKTCALLNIPSPSGYTADAVAWLREEFSSLGLQVEGLSYDIQAVWQRKNQE